MHRTLLLICSLFLISACTNQSAFEKHLRAGKDALIERDYDNAVKEFDLALIEKPTNKDAVALYERAKSALNEALAVEEEQKRINNAKLSLDEYRKSADAKAKEIKEFIESIDVKKITPEDAEALLKRSKQLSGELNELENGFSAENNLETIHQNLYQALHWLDISLRRINRSQDDRAVSTMAHNNARDYIKEWYKQVGAPE